MDNYLKDVNPWVAGRDGIKPLSPVTSITPEQWDKMIIRVLSIPDRRPKLQHHPISFPSSL